MTAGVCEIGYNPWIYWIFGECSYTILNHASIILGYLSIACWLNAQLPQIYQNYTSSDVDSLSPSFLIVWLFGDFTNMVGAVLTHQLPFQCYLATYFVLVDIILCIQFFYYKKPEITIDQQLQQTGIYPNSPTSDACSEEELVGLVSSSGNSIASNDDDDYSTPLNSTNPLGFSNLAVTTIKYIGIGLSVLFVFGLTAMHLNVRFTLAPPSEHTIYIIGRVISWVCAFLYLSSRLPQLIKNHQRKSVEGLSMFMFLFAFLGNLTYTISIVIVPHSYQSWMETLPFLIGSCGTLQFDAIMMYQFFKYNKMDRLRHRPLKSNPSSRVVTWVEDPFEAEFLLSGSYNHHSIHQHNQPANSSSMDLKL